MSAEIVQPVEHIEWIVTPEEIVETPQPPLSVQTALRATVNGKYGLHNLHIANPYTGEHIQVTTMPDYNGETVLEVIAPNGTSYWQMNGEHICGYYPEGITYLNTQSEWEQIQNNAFMNAIWSGVK